MRATAASVRVHFPKGHPARRSGLLAQEEMARAIEALPLQEENEP
jgi:hypothetical protein